MGCLSGYQQEGLCSNSEASTEAVGKAYNMCSGQPGALPNTQSSIVIMLQSSMPSSSASSSTVYTTLSVTRTTSAPAVSTTLTAGDKAAAAFFVPTTSIPSDTPSAAPIPSTTINAPGTNILVASMVPTPTSADNTSNAAGQSGTAKVAGGVIGGIIALLLIGLLIFCWRRGQGKEQGPQPEMQISAPLNTTAGLPASGPIAMMYANRFDDEQRASADMAGQDAQLGSFNDTRSHSSFLLPPPRITGAVRSPPSPGVSANGAMHSLPSPNPSALLPDKPDLSQDSNRVSQMSNTTTTAWSDILSPATTYHPGGQPFSSSSPSRPTTLLDLGSHAGSQEHMLGSHRQDLAEMESQISALNHQKRSSPPAPHRLVVPTKRNLLSPMSAFHIDTSNGSGSSSRQPQYPPRALDNFRGHGRMMSKSSNYTCRAPSTASTQYLPRHLRTDNQKTFSAASMATTIDDWAEDEAEADADETDAEARTPDTELKQSIHAHDRGTGGGGRAETRAWKGPPMKGGKPLKSALSKNGKFGARPVRRMESFPEVPVPGAYEGTWAGRIGGWERNV